MFDLITGKTRHIPSTPGIPVLISMTAQVTVVTALLVPALFFTGALPDVPTMMAFVAEAAPPPPPPPPPPPAARTSTPPPTQPVPAPGAAPVEPPSTIQPEQPLETGEIDGVPGGVEGGIPGGVPGGIVGGLLSDIPPPPPPPAPAPKAPVRVGGDIKPPTLAHRVEPIYPEPAVQARLHGVVILEAIVNREGRVIEVTVLRSAGRLLDDAAITAVKQWVYRPLVLNGTPEQFVLTVVLTFNLRTDS
jgi:protein TonB